MCLVANVGWTTLLKILHMIGDRPAKRPGPSYDGAQHDHDGHGTRRGGDDGEALAKRVKGIGLGR